MRSEYNARHPDAIAEARRDFRGAKLLLFAGPWLIALRRDFTPGIPWPGRLDLPGGGRDGDETPEACVLRETQEELGLTLAETALAPVHIHHTGAGRSWFFAAHLSRDIPTAIRFGSEGQSWLRLAPRAFAESDDAIPHFRAILARYLDQAARSP